MSQKIFACLPRTETTDFNFIENPEGSFFSFIQQVCMIVVNTDIDKAEILMLAIFILSHSANVDCRFMIVSV